MDVVVTGCNGHLGRVCCARILECGHLVTGIDARATGDREFPVVVADLRDPHAIHRAFDAASGVGGAPSAVVHLANHPRSDVAPAETVLRENLAMNTSVFVGALERGVGRMVFSSSVQAALGGVEREFAGEHATLPERLPIDEAATLRPANTYGLSKVLTESMLDHLCRISEGGFSAVSLRFPYVMTDRGFRWGVKRQAPSEQLMGATEAFIYVHVEDAAEAVRLAIESDKIEGHQVIWACAPDPRPPDPIDEIVERTLKSVPGAVDAAADGGFVDTSKAERLLGWRAERTLRAARSADGA